MFQVLPAIALVGLCAVLSWCSSKLWDKWRMGLGVCLLLQAGMSLQLALQVRPEHETGTLARNYFIVAALLIVLGAVAIAWHRQSCSPH